MKGRIPTKRQFDRLLVVGSGSMIISGGDRGLRAMVKRGWLSTDPPGSDNGFRITAEGFRALADAMEKYGLEPIKPPDRPTQPPVSRFRSALYKIARENRGTCPCYETAQAALHPEGENE
jgi:hypothetical protein